MWERPHFTIKSRELFDVAVYRAWLSKRVVWVPACGVVALYVLLRYFRKRKKFLECEKWDLQVTRRNRSCTIQDPTPSDTLGRKGPYNWPEIKKEPSEAGSINSVSTLVDSTPLTPQQFGLMGMEALDTVVGYWEDALGSYRNSKKNPSAKPVLTGPQEAEFTKSLQYILDGAYLLQDEAEHLFIHEHSVLNRKSPTPGESEAASSVVRSFVTSAASKVSSHQRVLSVSTVDGGESFVSAQDTVADLNDFDDFKDIIEDLNHELFNESLLHLELKGIPYRGLRSDFVGVESDSEYLGKLHCIRLAFKHLMSQTEIRNWWIDTGRKILSHLLVRSNKDAKDFVASYDCLMEYLSVEENVNSMIEELESRNVKCANFYDIVLDYIIIDSFADLEDPPSSVLAVMKNRWLSDGFKESALQTAVWSVLKAKRRLLRYPNGFKAQFYNLSEILTPILAWGFFGPDVELNNLMNFFKDHTLGFIRDLYSFQHVRYTNVDTMSEDIMNLAKKNLTLVCDYMKL